MDSLEIKNKIKLINNSVKNNYDYINKLTIQELEQIIEYVSNEYYNTKKTSISDNIFDILVDRLKDQSPNSIILNKIGSNPISSVKTKLDYWMGSMNKIKLNSKELENWTIQHHKPYIISEKLDGVSALLTVNNTVNLYTRGNGCEGTNISKLIPYLNIPTYNDIILYCKKYKIKGTINIIAFRGELVIKKEIYEHKWKDKFTTSRAAVAGLVNSKKIDTELCQDISLVIYELVDPIIALDKQYNLINNLGFELVNYKVIDKELSYNLLTVLLDKFKKKSKYQIDGIIVTALYYKRNTSGNPSYAFAFKFSQNSISAIVKTIEWNISKDGYIKPTIIINPIKINNTTIKRTTGYNARYIVDNIIGKGSILEIELSGDVIPHITNIIKPADDNKPNLPKYNWKWNDTKIDIILLQNDHQNINIKNIYYFFKFLKIKGIGEQTIKKLYDCGHDTILKILSISIKDLSKIKSFKEKSSKNFLNCIIITKQILSNISLDKLIVASNKLGHGLGTEKIKSLIQKFPNIISLYKNLSTAQLIDNLMTIDGWSIKTTEQFINNFSKFLEFYYVLEQYIKTDFSSSKQIINKYNSLIENKIFVFSGFRNIQLENLITSFNGIVKTTISKKTDYLIVKDKTITTNSKIKFAKENNISIIDISELNLIVSQK